MQIAFAGPAAEKCYCKLVGGVDAERDPLHYEHEDREIAWAVAQQESDGDKGQATRLMLEMQAASEARVDSLWERIFEAAVILDVSGHLSGVELDALGDNARAFTPSPEKVSPNPRRNDPAP
jgi:hypothetical protein